MRVCRAGGWNGTLTEWLTPHMTTLSRGSLARNSFTFWATKCFFLVFVLLAMDAAMLAAEAMFKAKYPAAAAWKSKQLSLPYPLRLARPPTTHDSVIARLVIKPANSRVPNPSSHPPSVRHKLGEATLTQEA